MRAIRIVVLTALTAVLAGLLAGCGPDAPPAVYRGSECPLAAQIVEAWAGTGDEHWAVDVAIRESRCNPDAYNQSGATGVFQIMTPLHNNLIAGVCGDPQLVWDATCNISVARTMWDGSGRRPWNF